MKILLCNVAIRNKPDQFPPVACTTLFNVLKRNGYDTVFYDINALRPDSNELSEFFTKGQFDIVGISAVVSTSYQNVKRLADTIKELSPKTQIILGGNLAAAYEILLRKCKIDICVVGEGERVILNLAKHWETHRSFKPNDDLRRIKGLVFMDEAGFICRTGYEVLIDAQEIEEPDYELLDQFSNIGLYIFDPLLRSDFACDSRAYEKSRLGKKAATIFTSKGCINSCTFCHRWVKGYRIIPVQNVINSMKFLIKRFNVGFFCISDECFGENRIWLQEFIRLVSELDVLFQIGGARVSMLNNNPMIMKQLKDAGLTTIYFGIESGSDKMLSVMGKNATSAQNLAALESCRNSGVYTVIQLVIGMPGENDQTINETIEFIKSATGGLPHPPLVTVIYLQSLPGTPSYEFLKYKGIISDAFEEEKYLLGVSDINASDFRQYINVSEKPLSKVKLWKIKIYFAPMIYWLKLHDWKLPAIKENSSLSTVAQGNNAKDKFKLFVRKNIFLYKMIDCLNGLFWRLVQLMNQFLLYGIIKTLLMTLNLRKEEDRASFKIGAMSLREVIKNLSV